MSKPHLSRLILVGTALIIAAVLLVWLLLWITRTRGGIEGWWVNQTGLGGPVIGHQAGDLQPILRGSGGGVRDIAYSALEPALRGKLRGERNRPIVLYISAAGVSAGDDAFLLRPEPGSLARLGPADSRQSLLTVRKLVRLLDEAPSRKKLLILDAGQVGSDRNLGVFGNDFLHQLKLALGTAKPKGLAILSSCAPGQSSWTSETDRRSVFGYYVSLGLSGKASGWDPSTGALTVQALHNYVRHNVMRWVAAHRQADQTPELIGDLELNFTLRQSAPIRAVAPLGEDKEAARLFTRLDQSWTEHDALLALRPYRHAPLLWQQYQANLLHAERLIRHAEYASAEDSLGRASAQAKRLQNTSGGLPMAPSWSLALLESDLANHPNESRRGELKTASELIDQAVKEFLSDVEGTEQAGPSPEKKPVLNAGEPKPPGDPASGAPDAAGKPQGAASGPAPVAEQPPPAAKPDKPKPKKATAIAALMAWADESRPLPVEAQLPVWADSFIKRGGVPNPFRGRRGELLEEAVRSRRSAERAAASDERISRWVIPLVEDGDGFRRRAQDALFAGDAAQLDEAGRWLEQARSSYEQARSVAGRLVAALDLLQKLEAELPSYGEWKARQGQRGDEGLDQEFINLLTATASLARLIDAGPVVLEDGPSASREPEAASAAGLEQVKKLGAHANDVQAAFDRLQGEFQTHCAALAASGGTGRWREIDRVLCVPTIPAALRKALLQRAHSTDVASTLGSMDTALAPRPEAKPSTVKGYISSQAGKAVEKSRATNREEISEAVASSEGPSAPDPDFWKDALGLARLEWGLFEIGGGSEAGLARLKEGFQAVRKSLNGDASQSFDAFARFSETVRSLRAERRAAITQVQAPAYAPLIAADRSARVLPLADALALSDRTTESLDRFYRHSLLLWHGTRFLKDFSPGQAIRLFENARLFYETEPLRIATEKAAAMNLAKLTVTTKAPEVVVAEWDEQPMDLGLATVGTVPPGDAAVLVGYDPAHPLTIVEKATRRPAREGTLAPVGPDGAGSQIAFEVARTESTPETVRAPLNAGAFYRGRYFPSDREFRVVLEPARDPVQLTIQQAFEGLKFKRFKDQFKEHPGQGFLHFDTNLQYKLVLTSDRPVKAWVRYGLKEKPESFKTRVVDLVPGKKGEIIDKVLSSDFPIVKEEGLLNLAPLNLEVTVRKAREDGEVQAKARYSFQMIHPSQYIAASTFFNPATRTIFVQATHLASDKATGPVEVFASIGGSNGKVVLERSQFFTFTFQVPTTVTKVACTVGVESLPSVFREVVETPAPAPAPAPPAQ